MTVADQPRSAFVVQRYRAKRKLRPTIIVLGDAARATPSIRRGLRFPDFVARGGVVAYAEAPGSGWTIGASGAAPSEVAYLRALIGRLRRNALSDPRRIYLVGVGSGGLVALQAACSQTRLFAGVAGALASLPDGQTAGCAPSRAIPTMLIAGDADKRLPFSGGFANLRSFKGHVAPVAETLGAFARAAGCSGKTASRRLPDRVRGDASRVTILRQTGCKARIQLVRVQGGGHFLPGLATSRRIVRGQNRDVNTARLITSFFRL